MKFSTLANKAIKYLMRFVTTYFCEAEFSILLLHTKLKKRHMLKYKDGTRLTIVVIQPEIISLEPSQN
jgi:hypothetical protein